MTMWNKIIRYNKKEIKNFLKRSLIKAGYSGKPDFLIIGVQKAGTTSLFHILQQHSHITASSIKEIHYFDNDDWYQNGSYAEYHQYFPLPYNYPSQNLLFEASPLYIYHPKTAERLYKYNPNLKLILILREPAQRALSAWSMYHHYFKKGIHSHLHDSRSFNEAVKYELQHLEELDFYKDSKAYVKRGIYIDQLKRYLQYFPKNQILIAEQKNLIHNFLETSRKICDFLCIPFERLQNRKKNKRVLDNKNKHRETLHRLQKFYQPHNEELFDFIGQNYDW